ncbi:MAG: NYN domain-containing protein [Lachnospiraceae bacterium]|nr:NYN domain-containing protein [Lachnospiraceae bacterium]
MGHIVFGILAQVDAGKTTLSESLLLSAGVLKKAGRVDKKDAFLDNYELERERGITIFSKQAEFQAFGKDFTLLDTPGHVDFSVEMERVLSVLDVAVLVISASAGVQSQVSAIWKLLKHYDIPAFIFVNKMDQPDTSKEKIIIELKEKLDSNIIDYADAGSDKAEYDRFKEEVSLTDETVLEAYMETGSVDFTDIQNLVRNRKLFPVFFGSALKYEGVDEFLKSFAALIIPPVYGNEFAARVFKIARDDAGNRLTYMKLMGGSLSVREMIGDEKVTGIRIYSGGKYESRDRVEAGEVCVVTGLKSTKAGGGLGLLSGTEIGSVLKQVMSYKVELPEDEPAHVFLPKIREISEEIPELSVKYSEEKKEITISLMGEVQTEVLKHLIKERYNVDIGFGEGHTLYKETIAETVYGVGHFEPLRHYAEVELRLEPAERGSGLSFASEVSEDELSLNYQRLILSHLEEKEYKGVLTGSPITDMKITLVAGRAHLKHTEGGDFRQATYRAVRQGLMQACSVLLEPVYEFKLEVPEEAIGRAMTDIGKMNGSFSSPENISGKAVLIGKVPVSEVKNYALELRAYTKGEGILTLTPSDYEVCHNAEEVIEATGYYPEADIENTADSVFCSHGAGFVVPWNEVINYMHLPYFGDTKEEESEEEAFLRYANRLPSQVGSDRGEVFLGTDEIDSILKSAVSSNKKKEEESARNRWKGRARADEYPEIHTDTKRVKSSIGKDDYLLVDGYNIIFAWQELKELADINIDSARDKLIEKLANYQGYKGCKLILVFDAYKVKGGKENVIKQGDMWIVYTKEAETADRYIAKASLELTGKGLVRVATSDALIQMIIFGSGAVRTSARELEAEVKYVEGQIAEKLEKM